MQWIVSPNNEVAWDRVEDVWQVVEGNGKYNTIYDEDADELGSENSELTDDIYNSLNDNQWCMINPYSVRTYKEVYYTWKIFCEQVKCEIRYFF